MEHVVGRTNERGGGGGLGLAPGMEPGISPTGAPLSAQETNSGLNIDSPAQSQAGCESLPFRARAVYQPPVEN